MYEQPHSQQQTHQDSRITLKIHFSRCESTGDLPVLSEAISNQQQVAQLTSNDHLDLPIWLNSFGIAFLSRSERTGDVSDFSETILIQQKTVHLTSDIRQCFTTTTTSSLCPSGRSTHRNIINW